MVKNSGENGDNLGKGPNPKGEIAFEFGADVVHPTTDGAIIVGSINCSEPVTAQEAHEAAVEHYGVDAESVAVRGLSGHQETGKGKGSSVGFAGRPWKTSWVPEADREKDDGPTLL